MTIFVVLNEIAAEFIRRYSNRVECTPLAVVDAGGRGYSVRFVIANEYAFGWGAWLRRLAEERLPGVPVEIDILAKTRKARVSPETIQKHGESKGENA